MNEDELAVVKRMIDHAKQYPRVNQMDREISEYQRDVAGCHVTYFVTLTKATLSLARRKTFATRSLITKFRREFNVPKKAMVERVENGGWFIVRITWGILKQSRLPIAVPATARYKGYE